MPGALRSAGSARRRATIDCRACGPQSGPQAITEPLTKRFGRTKPRPHRRSRAASGAEGRVFESHVAR